MKTDVLLLDIWLSRWMQVDIYPISIYSRLFKLLVNYWNILIYICPSPVLICISECMYVFRILALHMYYNFDELVFSQLLSHESNPMSKHLNMFLIWFIQTHKCQKQIFQMKNNIFNKSNRKCNNLQNIVKYLCKKEIWSKLNIDTSHYQLCKYQR